MRQRGFTLVEMMVAIVIGMVLVAGTLSVFLSTKQGYRMVTGMSLMQATGRATIDLLAGDIMMAGFPQSMAIETFVSGIGFTEDGGGNSSDMFTIRYQATSDCLNTAGGTPVYGDGRQYAKNRYFIQNGNLVCQTLAEDDTVINTGVMVTGIENMQVLYGEDNDAADGFTNATRYVTAGNVSNWGNVVSVKIGFVVNSQNIIATSNDTATFSLIGQTATAAAADRLRRRAYSSTVVIRNRMQES